MVTKIVLMADTVQSVHIIVNFVSRSGRARDLMQAAECIASGDYKLLKADIVPIDERLFMLRSSCSICECTFHYGNESMKG